MKKPRYLFLTYVLLISLFSTCEKDDYSEKINLEDRIFDNYLLSNNITTEPTESGLYYIEEVEGTGVAPLYDNMVLLNYSLYTLHDENLVYTTDEILAGNLGIYDDKRLYGPNKIQQGYNIAGFNEGLSLMKEGGKARLLFKSDLGYEDKIIGPIAAYSSLIVDIELLKVITDPVLEEYENTINYLLENEYSTDTTELGIYYIEISEGKGDLILADDLVTLSVKASLLDGRILYDSENIEILVGSFDYESTTGLSEGLKYMRTGGASKIVVPYQLAFGPYEKTYYGGYYKVPIPPYSTIVYDVEISVFE